MRKSKSSSSCEQLCAECIRIVSKPIVSTALLIILLWLLGIVYIFLYLHFEIGRPNYNSNYNYNYETIDSTTYDWDFDSQQQSQESQQSQQPQEQQQNNIKAKPKKPNSKNIAVAVLITKDPGIKAGFLDSAGALTIAIEEANSIHNITMIAIIHKDVKKCVPILKALGYEIRAYDLPFQASEVKNKQIGQEMIDDGCCGLLETLKLYVWLWTEFDYVLEVDADVHFHKNFDELFLHNTTLGWTKGATANINQELMNGGYLIVKPNPYGPKHFQDMIDVMKEGDFSGRGWKNSGVGWVCILIIM